MTPSNKNMSFMTSVSIEVSVATTRAVTLINSQNQTNLMRVDQGVCNQRQHKVKTLCSTSFFALNDENKRK